jgi:integration host factor subunit alpha
MGNTVIKATIARELDNKIGLSLVESGEFVSTTLEEISTALEIGEKVKISSFGSFSIHHKNERIGRNPRTGTTALISKRRVLSFRASDTLRERLKRK